MASESVVSLRQHPARSQAAVRAGAAHLGMSSMAHDDSLVAAAPSPEAAATGGGRGMERSSVAARDGEDLAATRTVNFRMFELFSTGIYRYMVPVPTGKPSTPVNLRRASHVCNGL